MYIPIGLIAPLLVGRATLLVEAPFVCERCGLTTRAHAQVSATGMKGDQHQQVENCLRAARTVFDFTPCMQCGERHSPWWKLPGVVGGLLVLPMMFFVPIAFTLLVVARQSLVVGFGAAFAAAVVVASIATLEFRKRWRNSGGATFGPAPEGAAKLSEWPDFGMKFRPSQVLFIVASILGMAVFFTAASFIPGLFVVANGLDAAVSVRVGDDTLEVPGGEYRTLRLMPAERRVVVSVGGTAVAEEVIAVREGDDVTVYNVFGAAPVYSEIFDQLGDSTVPRLWCGQTQMRFKRVDDAFVDARLADSRSRVHVDLAANGWRECVRWFEKDEHAYIPAAHIAAAVLAVDPTNAEARKAAIRNFRRGGDDESADQLED